MNIGSDFAGIHPQTLESPNTGMAKGMLMFHMSSGWRPASTAQGFQNNCAIQKLTFRTLATSREAMARLCYGRHDFGAAHTFRCTGDFVFVFWLHFDPESIFL